MCHLSFEQSRLEHNIMEFEKENGQSIILDPISEACISSSHLFFFLSFFHFHFHHHFAKLTLRYLAHLSVQLRSHLRFDTTHPHTGPNKLTTQQARENLELFLLWGYRVVKKRNEQQSNLDIPLSHLLSSFHLLLSLHTS